MHSFKKIFTILVFTQLCCFMMLYAQPRKVKSGTYNLLLKKLLPHNVPEITVDSLSKIAAQVTLLDAREIAEYNVSHLQHATFVGYNNFAIDSLKNIDKDAPIVVYCSVGYRSAKITEKLIQNGYTNVQNLYGGIFEWKNENNLLYNKDGETNNVHPYSSSWGIWLKKGKKVYK